MSAPTAADSVPQRWRRFALRGAQLVVSLIVLGLVAWLAYVALQAGVDWPWLLAVVPAALGGGASLFQALVGQRPPRLTARRRRWQFSLRAAMLLVMLVALGLVAWRAYEEPY